MEKTLMPEVAALRAVLSLDNSGFERNARQSQGTIGDVEKSAKAANVSISGLSRSLTGAAGRFERLSLSGTTAQKVMRDYAREAVKAGQAGNGFGSELRSALSGLTKSVNTAAVAQSKLTASMIAGEAAQSRLNAVIGTTRGELSSLAESAGGAAKAVSQFEGGMRGGAGSLLGFASPAGIATQALSALKDAFVGSIKNAADFEERLLHIQANTGQTTAEISRMRDAVLSMGKESGVPFESLADGLSHVKNFGYGVADSQKILNTAMKVSVATGADAAQTANLLAGTMKNFGLEAGNSIKTANALLIMSQRGNLTMSEFNAAAGPAIAMARIYGVSLTQVGSVISTFTQHQYSANQAATAARNIMQQIVHPTVETQKVIARLSHESGVNLVRDFSAAGLKLRGFDGFLQDVRKSTGDNIAKQSALFNNMRGGQAMLLLLNQGFRDYKNTSTAAAEAMAGRVNPVQEAYNRSLHSTNTELHQLGNDMQGVGMQIGNSLLPVLNQVANSVRHVLHEFQNLPKTNARFDFSMNVREKGAGASTSLLSIQEQLATVKSQAQSMAALMKANPNAAGYGPAGGTPILAETYRNQYLNVLTKQRELQKQFIAGQSEINRQMNSAARQAGKAAKITPEGPPLDMSDMFGGMGGGGGAWPSMAEYGANQKAGLKAAKQAASEAKRAASEAIRAAAQQAREADRAYKDFFMAISGRVLDKFELRAFDLKEKEARYLDAIFDPAGITQKGQAAGRALMQVLKKNSADQAAFYKNEQASAVRRATQAIATGETAHARADVLGITSQVKSGALSKRQGVDLLSTIQDQYSGPNLTAALAVVKKGIAALSGEASQLKTIQNAIAGAQAKYLDLTVTKQMATAATEAERLSLSLLKTPYSSLSSEVRAYVDTLSQATAKTKAFEVEQKQWAEVAKKWNNETFPTFNAEAIEGAKQWAAMMNTGLKSSGAINAPKLSQARRDRMDAQADAIAAPIGQAARASLDTVFNRHSRDWAKTFTHSMTESMKSGLSDLFGNSVQSMVKSAIRPLFDDLGHQLGRSLSTGLEGVGGTLRAAEQTAGRIATLTYALLNASGARGKKRQEGSIIGGIVGGIAGSFLGSWQAGAQIGASLGGAVAGGNGGEIIGAGLAAAGSLQGGGGGGSVANGQTQTGKGWSKEGRAVEITYNHNQYGPVNEASDAKRIAEDNARRLLTEMRKPG